MSEAPPMTDTAIRQLLADSPFCAFLAPEIVTFGEADAPFTVRVRYRREFGRMPTGTQWHGGVLTAVADTTATFGLIAHTRKLAATVDLRMDFLRPTMEDMLLATARVVRAGRTLSVVDATLSLESGKPVATARGTFVSL